jgi:hypothetical protein
MQKRILQHLFPRVIVQKGDRNTAWEAGYNAQNNFFRIRIWSDLPEFAAILAQERREWGMRWAWFPISLFRPKWFLRRLEYHGHAVEVVVARDFYGTDEAEKIAWEAKSLTLYRQFRGVPEEELAQGIRNCLPAAERWVGRKYGRVWLDMQFRMGSDE